MTKRRTTALSALIGVLGAGLLGATTDQIMNAVYIPGVSPALRVTLTGGAAATSITSGTTTITGGTDTSPCFQDGASPLGVINCGDNGWSWNKTTNALTSTTFIGALTGNADTATLAATGDSATAFFSAGTLELARGGTGASSLTGSRCLQTNAGGTALEVAAGACGTGAGTVTGSGTAGLMPVWSTTTALGDSSCFPTPVTNDTVTGTTVNKLAKVKTTTGTAIITAAAETSGILGVVTGGAGNSGSAQVCMLGITSCVFDNATTNGHFVGVSSSVAGDCTDLGTNDYTTIAAGTTVLGTATVTAAAGTRAMLLGTPDVQGQSGGGGNNKPGGVPGDVQYRATGNNFAAEAAFNYDATNNRLALTGMTTATDNASNMFKLTGTLPASPSTTVNALRFDITSAGSAAQVQEAQRTILEAGYTGAAYTAAQIGVNVAAGTGANLELGSATPFPIANHGQIGYSASSTVGYNIGATDYGAGSTTGNIGTYGFASDSGAAGPNIGGLFAASNSLEGTNPKNIGAWATITTGNPLTFADNVSFALGAASDGTGDIFRGYNTTTKVYSISKDGNAATAGTITSSNTGTIGWSVVAGADTACTTTCTSACVAGFANAVTGQSLVACSDATADSCLCGGAS